MKRFILIFLILPFTSICKVDTIHNTNSSTNNDIYELVSKYKRIIKNKKTNWKLQIKFTSKRGDIVPYKIKFNNLYPEISTLIIFESPYYKLLAGDFQTKNEALKIRNIIKTHFPAAHPIKHEN
tara:strand:+ start:4763 stop:5134 length:372 start_codon:yes stop_codon:yes gene_type:complete